MKKALIILRVSDQHQEERNSLEKQEEQALHYCSFKGYEIYKVIKTVVSGRKNNREDFLELEREIEENNFDVLVFYELSRLARNAYFIHKLVHSMRIKEISFESITESYLNEGTPTSKIMLGIMASQAEIESDIISKRVRNRMQFYASQGYHLFPAPKGYRLENKVLVIDEADSQNIREIFKKFLEGSSYKSLSREYNLSSLSIKRILGNVTYLGKIKFGFEGKNPNTGKWEKNKAGAIYEGKHKAIIDDTTFGLVQELINQKDKSRNKVIESDYILTGLMHHKCDNSRMFGKTHRRKKTGLYRLYYCNKCYKTIKADILEELILSSLKEKIVELNFLEKKSINKKVKNVQDVVNKLFSKRGRIIEMYGDGVINREEYLKNIKDIDKKISELDSKDKKIEKDTNMDILLKDKLVEIIENFENLTISEKKSLLNIFIEEIIIDDEVLITFKF
ncbi:recombinase family protein [Cetobacterium sp. 2A]|uniref:recombinase family protein n=1 Tax=Cetobacterium sp. 2A TaxID=2754723 RepID=UPI00163C6C20|nr:recombinase family protein [Cetobacterium sp. 2A]MBC2855446.1 recombinase family protein [Cetobacterium sp. 2A]